MLLFELIFFFIFATYCLYLTKFYVSCTIITKYLFLDKHATHYNYEYFSVYIIILVVKLVYLIFYLIKTKTCLILHNNILIND